MLGEGHWEAKRSTVSDVMRTRTWTWISLLCTTLSACDKTGTNARPLPTTTIRLPTTATDATAPGSDALAATAATDACTGRPPQDNGTDLLELAFEDGVLDRARVQRCLVSLSTQDPPPRRRARVFALARRLPASNLAAFWDSVRIDERTLVLRALGGRARTDAPPAPPTAWGLDPSRDPALATVVSRFRLETPSTPSDAQNAVNGLASPDLDRQLATARWLRMVPWTPTLDDLSTVSTTVTPVLVKSLADGPAANTVDWGGWMTFVARRARLAPRLWGNAWRALRDGVPKAQWTTANVTAWVTALDAQPRVRGLEGDALAWFTCEDAAAVDRWTGRVERTMQCASAATERWVSQVLRARVLGELRTGDAERARALTALRREAASNAQVLSEIATAACALPRGLATPIVTALARERDPGVLASLLQGLVEHPEIARGVDATVRDALVRAPFEAPEGPMLEARVQAIKLARLLRRDELIASAQSSQVRVIHRTLDPEAGVGPAIVGEPVLEGGPTRVRFVTDAGSFELALEPERAPRAVAHFRTVLNARRYDGLRFHRIVPGFVAQGGDPRGDGYGGTESPVVTELSLGAFERGAVGVPLSGLDTGGMQLFIMTADTPSLDGRYPWIGRVVRGIEVVEGLLPGDRIVRAEWIDGG
jgi:cyclophilin family peptidyl-prolyl cis-trans isomerase